MGDTPEEDAVDSGWDLVEQEEPQESPPAEPQRADEQMEREQAKRARWAALEAIADDLAATDLAATTEAPALADPDLASTVEAPVLNEPSSGVPTVRGSVDSTTWRQSQDEPEPPTRRAEDEELVAVRDRVSREPPLRIGGRASEPLRDMGVHARSTPPKGIVSTSLRFSQGSVREARKRRATTKVNLAAVNPALIPGAVPSERGASPKTSAPELDLQLPDSFDDLTFGAEASPAEVTPTHEPRPEPPKRGLKPPPKARKPSRTLPKAAKEPPRDDGPPPTPRPPPHEGVLLDLDEIELSDEERDALAEAEARAELDLSELDEPGAVSTRATAPPPPLPETAEKEDPQLEAVRVRFERGDFAGALLRAEAILEARPEDDTARRYLESARDMMRQMYLDKLGSGHQVLRVVMAPGDIQNLSLDHRAGFLISLLDGVATIDEVMDMSGMPQLDVLRLLFEMREQGVVIVSQG